MFLFIKTTITLMDLISRENSSLLNRAKWNTNKWRLIFEKTVRLKLVLIVSKAPRSYLNPSVDKVFLNPRVKSKQFSFFNYSFNNLSFLYLTIISTLLFIYFLFFVFLLFLFHKWCLDFKVNYRGSFFLFSFVHWLTLVL